LKIEATVNCRCRAFAGEMQPRANAALHRFEIDLVEVHAAAGDKLFFELAFALHNVVTAFELIDQRGEVAFGDFRPAAITVEADGSDQATQAGQAER
jgi:hypothetical protein